LAEEALAEQFVKARRKLQAVGTGVEKAVEQAVRNFKEIEFMERDRLTGALDLLDGEFVMSAWTVPKNGRGRKPAKKDHFECRYFVHELLTAVRRSGGELSFEMPTGGHCSTRSSTWLHICPAALGTTSRRDCLQMSIRIGRSIPLTWRFRSGSAVF
jgi:hypothetical protein